MDARAARACVCPAIAPVRSPAGAGLDAPGALAGSGTTGVARHTAQRRGCWPVRVPGGRPLPDHQVPHAAAAAAPATVAGGPVVAMETHQAEQVREQVWHGGDPLWRAFPAEPAPGRWPDREGRPARFPRAGAGGNRVRLIFPATHRATPAMCRAGKSCVAWRLAGAGDSRCLCRNAPGQPAQLRDPAPPGRRSLRARTG